jgi:CheY-like chemotaxis protein
MSGAAAAFLAWYVICVLHSRLVPSRVDALKCRAIAQALERLEEVSGMITTNKPYSILITDDDRGCREALRDIFASEGYLTFLASSGEEALEISQDRRVHLALLDMHLPNLTGLETLALLRQINAMLPCILVTADANEQVMRQAFLAHAYSVIPKPVSKNVVLYTVVRALVRAYGNKLREPPAEG